MKSEQSFVSSSAGRLSADISHLRKSYERAELNEEASEADPLRQFARWFDEARASQVPEPNAMTLATVGSDMRPSTRIVLIKDFDERGLVWFSNYESRKGQELAGNPWAALQFHWVELERVVRVEGRVRRVEEADSDAYYASRPLDSRIGAWASPQSRPIPGRAWLVAEAAQYAARFLLNPPRPPHWGGWRLEPDRWEFWQGRKSRLHDRLLYTRAPGAESAAFAESAESGSAARPVWLRQRLAP